MVSCLRVRRVRAAWLRHRLSHGLTTDLTADRSALRLGQNDGVSSPDFSADPASCKGKLLVATPPLTDPHFDRTVVYMLEHTADGAVVYGLLVAKRNGE